MEHLVLMDQLREGIGLRGYAQRDPMVEYKREGHEKFETLISNIYSSLAEKLNVAVETGEAQLQARMPSTHGIQYQRGHLESGLRDEAGETSQAKNVGARVEKVVSGQDKIGRNDPCPCGSGLKWKKCGMINAPEHKG